MRRLRPELILLLAGAAYAIGSSRSGDPHLEPHGSTTTWQTTDGWSVDGSRLLGDASEGELELGSADEFPPDVAMEATVRFLDSPPGGRVTLFVRDGAPDHLAIHLVVFGDGREESISLRVPKEDAIQEERRLQDGSLPESTDRANLRIRFLAQGVWLRVFVDDEQVFATPRGYENPEGGRVGVRIRDGRIAVESMAVRELASLPAQERDAPLAGEPSELRGQPLVVAHRGFNWTTPENTLASLRLALESGVPIAEVDVRATQDGIPVVLHDPDLERTAGVERRIDEITLAEAKTYDVGSWKSSEFASERIPTVREALELTRGRLPLILEIKPKGIERKVLNVVRASGILPRDVTVLAYHLSVLDSMAILEPSLPTMWLAGMPSDAKARRAMMERALRAKVRGVAVSLERIDPAVVELAHASGLSVWVWTANRPADLRFLLDIGVDGIISDRPDVLDVLDTLRRDEG